jgi:hypothetical protein
VYAARPGELSISSASEVQLTIRTTPHPNHSLMLHQHWTN